MWKLSEAMFSAAPGTSRPCTPWWSCTENKLKKYKETRLSLRYLPKWAISQGWGVNITRLFLQGCLDQTQGCLKRSNLVTTLPQAWSYIVWLKSNQPSWPLVLLGQWRTVVLTSLAFYTGYNKLGISVLEQFMELCHWYSCVHSLHVDSYQRDLYNVWGTWSYDWGYTQDLR